jgi:hypothetical protein
MKKFLFLLCIIFISGSAFSQPVYKLMSYNLLNYPGTDTTTRNPYLRTVISSVAPDILVAQEVTSQAGVDGFLNNVLNSVLPGYSAGIFINGPDTDNAIFLKSSAFTFLSNNPIQTTLRDINEFVIRENLSGDTLKIYSVHLKASSGSTNEQQRLAEVTILRNVTDALPVNSNFIICGDFNLYGANEPAYLKLKDQSSTGYFLDVINLSGIWNNSLYAQYHTQSPRVRQFGGGSNGGMDDRFDMILMSQAVMDPGGIAYQENSYLAYGNDGLHFNDSINRPPNNAVGQLIADALHYSSDHIPVLANFRFGEIVPVELISFSALVNDNNVSLRWTTSTETNNSGFYIERHDTLWNTIGFVKGSGNSIETISYEFIDYDLLPGGYLYRLRQVDNDGSFNYSTILNAEILPPLVYSLEQNFPNPFNSSSVIRYSVPETSHINISILDILGNQIQTVVDEQQNPGAYEFNWNASGLPSGVYFYQLKSSSFIETKKMMLMK